MRVKVLSLFVFTALVMSGSVSASPLSTVPNAGFESGLWSTAYYDTPALQHDTGSITLDSVIHHSGSSSAKLTMRGNSGLSGNQEVVLGLASNTFTLSAGAHTISVWLYAANHLATPPVLSFGAIYYDSGSNIIGVDLVPYDFTNIPNSTWVQANGDLTAPAGTASVRAYFLGRNYSIDSSTLTCNLDDFTIDGLLLGNRLPAANH